MTDQCIQYLEALYGGLSDGWMPIWTGQTKSTEWWQVQHLDDIADMAVKFGQDSDLYHGACVRAQELDAQHRGTAAGALYMPGLWLDIDIKGPAHSEKSLPTTLEEAVNLAYQAPERPTMIVHSGGGIHAWWLFETPLHLGGEETHNAAEQLSKDFQAHMRGVAAQHGWKLDNTSDLARVLRLPGTMNHKRAYREDGKAAPAVHFQESPEEHDDRRHPPRWWREKLQRPEQHGEQADTPPQAGERYLKVASALQYCKGATYEEWRDIGFAVHEAFPGEQGLALFNHWSRTQPNYKDEQDVRSQWEGIKRESGNRIGIGTLFRRAKELGWRCVGLLAKAEDERRLSPRPIAEVAPAALARIKDRVDGKVKPIHFPDEWVAHNDQLESLMHGGWWPGCYILIGNTGSGKTGFALQAARAAAAKGIPSVYISLEMDDLQLTARLVTQRTTNTSMSWGDIVRGQLTPEGWSDIEHLAGQLPTKLHIQAAPPMRWDPAEGIAATIEAVKKDHHTVFVVVDFLQLVASGDQDLRKKIGEAAYAGREAARNHNAVVLLVSSTARENYEHLARESTSKKKSMRPGIDPAENFVGLGKESGEIEYAADGVLVLCRAPGTDHIRLAVAKQRAGPVGWVSMEFNGRRGIFKVTDKNQADMNARTGNATGGAGGVTPDGPKKSPSQRAEELLKWTTKTEDRT